jgi:hypothetical protein
MNASLPSTGACERGAPQHDAEATDHSHLATIETHTSRPKHPPKRLMFGVNFSENGLPIWQSRPTSTSASLGQTGDLGHLPSSISDESAPIDWPARASPDRGTTGEPRLSVRHLKSAIPPVRWVIPVTAG